MSAAADGAPPHALLRLRIALPFLVVALIWGSTWYVITGQIDAVPPSWSVAYRFALATPAMFLVALAMRRGLAIGRAGHLLALAIEAERMPPTASLLAWSMLYGTLFDVVFALFSAGPPVFPTDPAFWAGTAWLALAGSVVTFPLYYTIVRQLGPGRAAYNGVLVIVIAMLISTLVEGYEWSLLAAGGAVLGITGMILALRARQV